MPVLVAAFLLVLAYVLSRLASTLSTHHTLTSFLYSLRVEHWGRMARTSLCELCASKMDDAPLLLYGKLHQMAYSGHQCLEWGQGDAPI